MFTIGHSTHSLDEFAALLARHEVASLVDVRAHPGSRRVPHFNDGSLRVELPARGIAYEHIRALGGRRRPRPGSDHAGWENDGFRGYADHMETREFLEALERLELLARERRTAVMCAEALWWRCHRRLIADALTVRGASVTHIAPDGRGALHELTPFAVVEAGRIAYPPRQASLDV